MYMRYTGHGNHFKDKRPNLEKRPGGLWALEGAHPGMEHYEAEFIRRYGDRAFALLDLAGSEPVNINVFPELLAARQPHPGVRAGRRRRDQRHLVRHHDRRRRQGIWATRSTDINALRMRTQEGFPNFGEVDDVANFEQIQRGLMAPEDEWVYMHRGLGIPGRIKTRRRRHHHGAGDRRGVHARALQGMETADEGAAESRDQAGAVTMNSA